MLDLGGVFEEKRIGFKQTNIPLSWWRCMTQTLSLEVTYITIQKGHVNSSFPKGHDRRIAMGVICGCFRKIVGFTPKSSNFNRVFRYKPSILGGNTPIFGNTHIYLLPTSFPSCLLLFEFAVAARSCSSGWGGSQPVQSSGTTEVWSLPVGRQEVGLQGKYPTWRIIPGLVSSWWPFTSHKKAIWKWNNLFSGPTNHAY